MKKAYLLVYSDALGNRDQIKVHLDAMSEVLIWRYELQNTFLISEASADELSITLRNSTKSTGRFIITEITSNKQGVAYACELVLDKQQGAEVRGFTNVIPVSVLSQGRTRNTSRISHRIKKIGQRMLVPDFNSKKDTSWHDLCKEASKSQVKSSKY